MRDHFGEDARLKVTIEEEAAGKADKLSMDRGWWERNKDIRRDYFKSPEEIERISRVADEWSHRER